MDTPRYLATSVLVIALSSSSPFVHHDAIARFETSGAPSSGIFQAGEDLVYEVSWTMFRLGTIHLRSHPGYSAEAQIHSYDNIPFVDLHAVQYSQMDSLFYSRGSHSAEKKEGEWWGLNYAYDTSGKRLMVEETYQTDLASSPYRRNVRDTIHMHTMDFLDGLSIGYFPRSLIHTEGAVTVPTVLNGRLGQTTFHPLKGTTTETIDADDKPIRVIEVEGTTSVRGIFGMNGDFTGWFSDDSAAVPIKGKLKVLLGSVTIELIQWRRTGWAPPH